MPRISFFIDAGVEIGTGHLMEGLALAGTFGKKFSARCNFIIRDFPPACDLVRAEGHALRIVPGGMSAEEEIAWIGSALDGMGADLLVCDLLDRPDPLYGALRARGVPLVVILDDEFHRPVDGDIVVNFSILQDPSFYRQFSGTGTRYLIGPAFMPLREELHERWLRERPIPERCRKIFVSQGGSDPEGFTAIVIRALELLDLDQEIAVVVGSAVPERHRRDVRRLIRRAHNTYSVRWGVPPREMGGIMEGSDLAITAPGNTIYELALFGIPSLTICLHERHLRVADAFAARGAAVNLGLGAGLTEGAIAGAVRTLLETPERRQDLSRGMKGIVDGLGTQRIAETAGGLI